MTTAILVIEIRRARAADRARRGSAAQPRRDPAPAARARRGARPRRRPRRRVACRSTCARGRLRRRSRRRPISSAPDCATTRCTSRSSARGTAPCSRSSRAAASRVAGSGTRSPTRAGSTSPTTSGSSSSPRTRQDESISALRKLAPRGLPVVMSSAAWTDYRVPGSPYFVLVDGQAGPRARAKAPARDWDQVKNLLAPGGRRRERRRRARPASIASCSRTASRPATRACTAPPNRSRRNRRADRR